MKLGHLEQRQRPCVEQLWHGNLQDDARALVILLQVGSVELGGHEVTFQGHYQGPNLDQYREISRPRAGTVTTINIWMDLFFHY
jgi:hypothetical protein